MVSWAVTGATRGIGFGFIENLSANPDNQVFALIRSRATAGPLEELAAKRKNLHIVVTDFADPEKLAEAASEVSKITAGSLDVLILNAGAAGPDTSTLPPTAFSGKQRELEHEIYEGIKINLLGPLNTVYAFLDLIRLGKEKKIISLSSMSGDIEFTRVAGLPTLMGYSVAKAGMNMVITKFATELAQESIKTLSLSPGWVATEAAVQVTGDPEVRKFMLSMFHKVDPNVTGPAPVEVAVADMLQVVKNLRAEDSGKFLSHHGNEKWF